MFTYERAKGAILLARLGEAPTRLIIVTGPRQTGKTALVLQVLTRAETPNRYLVVDEPEPATLPAPFPSPGEGGLPLSEFLSVAAREWFEDS